MWPSEPSSCHLHRIAAPLFCRGLSQSYHMAANSNNLVLHHLADKPAQESWDATMLEPLADDRRLMHSLLAEASCSCWAFLAWPGDLRIIGLLHQARRHPESLRPVNCTGSPPSATLVFPARTARSSAFRCRSAACCSLRPHRS